MGRAFVQEAVNKGDSVIAAVRKIPQNDILFQSENVLPVIMDVTRQDEVKTAVDKGLERFGQIDYLINNAGFGMNGACVSRVEKKKRGINCPARTLREEDQSILTEAALKHDLQERIEDLISFLDEQTEAVAEYSEALVRRLIEKVTVYDEKLVVEFKSGLTIEVEA